MERGADSTGHDADVVTGNWPDESIIVIINHGDQTIARGIKLADFPERLGAALRFLLGTVYGAAIELGLISVSDGELSPIAGLGRLPGTPGPDEFRAGVQDLKRHDAGRFVWLAEEDRDGTR